MKSGTHTRLLRDIPQLSEHDKQLCEGKITETEYKMALNDMKMNKSPDGLDGLIVEHYKTFWPEISDMQRDSIPKYIKICYVIFVQSCPGLTLSRLLLQIKMGKMATIDFKLIILHCGTNDVHSKTDGESVGLFSEIIIAIKQRNYACILAMSLVYYIIIIQRPYDKQGPRL